MENNHYVTKERWLEMDWHQRLLAYKKIRNLHSYKDVAADLNVPYRTIRELVCDRKPSGRVTFGRKLEKVCVVDLAPCSELKSVATFGAGSVDLALVSMEKMVDSGTYASGISVLSVIASKFMFALAELRRVKLMMTMQAVYGKNPPEVAVRLTDPMDSSFYALCVFLYDADSPYKYITHLQILNNGKRACAYSYATGDRSIQALCDILDKYVKNKQKTRLKHG